MDTAWGLGFRLDLSGIENTAAVGASISRGVHSLGCVERFGQCVERFGQRTTPTAQA